VSGTNFTPSLAGLGTHTITYDITLGSCSNQETFDVTVNPAPDATFSGLNASYCTADASSALVPTEAGGTFTGSGVSGTTFNPSTASLGTQTITYTITNGFGCMSTDNAITVVNQTPDASFSGLNASYCIYESTPIAIVPVDGSGTFTGTGVSGTNFTPSLAGLGTHTITYDITLGSCSNQATFDVTVNPAPDATFSGLNASYCTADASSTLVATELGGTFTGSGVSGTTFNPSTASLGTQTITYTITNGFGCMSTENQITTINETPDASFSGLNASYCIYESTAIAIVPVDGSGTFTGTGV